MAETKIAWVTLTDMCNRHRANRALTLAVLRTLASLDPDAWPYETVSHSTVLPRETAVKLMEHIDRVHRPHFAIRNRKPQASILAREFISNS